MATVLFASTAADASQGGRAGGLPATATATPAGTGAISGVVVDAATGGPVAGVIVGLGSRSGGPQILTLPRTVTDAKGRFLFRDLAPSTRYYLRAARLGYASTRYGAAGPAVPTTLPELEIRTIDDIATIAVAADQWVSDVRIQLWRLGSISGRVVDERHEPVVGAAVQAFSTTLSAGHSQYAGSDIATTDDRGEYRLANLAPGKYAVSVLSVQATVLASRPEGPQQRALGELAQGTSRISSGDGLPSIGSDARHRLALSNYATPPPPGGGRPQAYAATFYPATSTIGLAEAIEIGLGTIRRGVDFQLRPVGTVTVAGRVETPAGSGNPNQPPLLLRLMPAGQESLGVGSEAATTFVDPDGSFTFLNVPPGAYTLVAPASSMAFTVGGGLAMLPAPPGSSGRFVSSGWTATPGLSYVEHDGPTPKVWGRISVSVGESDVRGLVLPLRPTVTVRGRIVMAADAAARNISLPVNAEPANGDAALGNKRVYTSVPEPGTFALEGLAGGRYLIGAPLAGRLGVAVTSVMVEGREVRDVGIDTSSGRDLNDVVITLTDKAIDVSGTVRGASPVPAAVIVFPADRTGWTDYGWSPTKIQSKTVDTTGAFLIRGLPEGDYFVAAVPLSQHDAWTDPRFLEAASAVATRVSLKWGDKKVIDLTVNVVSVK